MLTPLPITGSDDLGQVWTRGRLPRWSGDLWGHAWTVLILVRIRRRWLSPTIATAWWGWARGWGDRYRAASAARAVAGPALRVRLPSGDRVLSPFRTGRGRRRSAATMPCH